MPLARRPTPPPEAIKQASTVMDSLNAWTTDEDVNDDEPKNRKVPLGYTFLGQADAMEPTEGWRVYFDSESDSFNVAIGCVIICNAVVIGLETDMGRGMFTIAEHLFNAIFVLEMLTRIGQIGMEYFTTPSYLFDCSLVLAGTLDLWILPAFSGGGGSSEHNTVGYQFSVMRLLRILRLLRVLRVIRLFRMFGHLLLMVKAFGKSIQVVMLLSVIVLIMIYALGIVCTQLIGHHSADWGDEAESVEAWFGDLSRSMMTLFQIMFGSGWENLLHVLTKVYPHYLVLLCFAGFCVITVALLALIMGLISESLITAQQQFKGNMVLKHQVSKKVLAAEYTEELKELLEDEMDTNECVDGMQLKQAVKGDNMLVTKLIQSGVQIQLDGLLNLVDNMSNHEKDVVNIDHFVEKLTNLSGQSTAAAIVDLKYDAQKNRDFLGKATAAVDSVKEDFAEHKKAMESLSRSMDAVLAKLK